MNENNRDNSDTFQRLLSECPKIIDIILDGLCPKDWIELRQTCQLLSNAVLSYMKRFLLGLPIFLEKSFLWLISTEFFYRSIVRLKPINRRSCRLVVAALSQFYKQGLYVNVNDGLGHCSVSLDNFPSQLIQTCDHWKPQRHTSSALLKLKIPSKATSATITRADFIMEYCNRIVENSYQDELLWINVENFSQFYPHLSLCFLGLLMETFLIGIEKIVAECNGNVAYRRSEFIANGGHFLLHRIWIQIFVTVYEKLDKKQQETVAKKSFQKQNVVVKKKFISATQRKLHLSPNQSQNNKASKDVSMLYLTIIDHFQWDS